MLGYTLFTQQARVKLTILEAVLGQTLFIPSIEVVLGQAQFNKSVELVVALGILSLVPMQAQQNCLCPCATSYTKIL